MFLFVPSWEHNCSERRKTIRVLSGRPKYRHPMQASVVVPVRNEVASIAPICETFANLMRAYSFIREVVFVDDGSSDGTLEEIKACSTYFSFVKSLSLSKPSGKGAAIKTGFQKSSGEIVVMMDGDQQYSPLDIPRLLEPILRGLADIVVGRGTNSHASFARRLSSRLFSSIFTRMFEIRVCYPMEGLKAVLKTTFEELNVSENGFDFDIALLVKANQRHLRITEVTIRRVERVAGKSKVRLLPTAFRFFIRMVKLWWLLQEK